jgi:hypothetical protein
MHFRQRIELLHRADDRFGSEGDVGLRPDYVRFARRSLHSAQLQARQSERNVQGHRSFDGDRLQGEAAS